MSKPWPIRSDVMCGSLFSLLAALLSARPLKVVSRRDFSVKYVAVDDYYLSAFGLDESGVVGAFAVRSMGAAQHLGTKRLRGLHRAKRTASRRANDLTGVVDNFDGVGDGNRRHGTVCPVDDRLDDTSKVVFIRERTRRVMHADDGGILGYRCQTFANRLAPRGSASNTAFFFRNVWREHNDDAIAGFSCDCYRPVHDASVAHHFELLRPAETRTRTCGNNDRPDDFARSAKFSRRHRLSG